MLDRTCTMNATFMNYSSFDLTTYFETSIEKKVILAKFSMYGDGVGAILEISPKLAEISYY